MSDENDSSIVADEQFYNMSRDNAMKHNLAYKLSETEKCDFNWETYLSYNVEKDDGLQRYIIKFNDKKYETYRYSYTFYYFKKAREQKIDDDRASGTTGVYEPCYEIIIPFEYVKLFGNKIVCEVEFRDSEKIRYDICSRSFIITLN